MSAVRSIMYAQVYTCPDIAFVVGMLGRYLSNLRMNHWIAVKKVLCYLQRTKDFALMYRRTDHLELVGYIDVDFTGCVDSKKSTSGYVFMMGGRSVSWKSIKQSITASSIMKAEYVACHEATIQAIWLQSFFSGLRVVQMIPKPLKIYCDSSVVVNFSNNSKYSSRSKHIDIKYLVVKERVQNRQVSLELIGTRQMIADPLTKGLPIMLFKEYVTSMGAVDPKDVFQ
ncbi:secreted RxLR effector protein 161-like [Magnolia sinica]|uniref:secreted RxLR effector protein 161-like n=1 Tax=Magnolia sinica TaxID=86752 RepID=UPI002658A212|nr:secreted RxLR effector protein 161-like [Magnolia sinica]